MSISKIGIKTQITHESIRRRRKKKKRQPKKKKRWKIIPLGDKKQTISIINEEEIDEQEDYEQMGKYR